MAESSGVPSMSWTSRNVGVTVLLAMEEHRKAAGRRVALLRDARGWSQEDLAHEAGISSRTVSRFETGRHDGRRGTVRAIAKALAVAESDILGPPPEPLGLGRDNGQLDRIEAKLDVLLQLVTGSDPREALVQELQDAVERHSQREHDTAADTPDPQRAAG